LFGNDLGMGRGDKKCLSSPMFRTKGDGRVFINHMVRGVIKKVLIIT
jgi:hypothetical protein